MTPPVNDLRELMLLYVTDGLDPSERESARRLIEANDPEALAALREAEELITRIPEALDPITPGAASTRRLMDRVFTKRVSGPAQAATSTRPHQSSRASNLALAASFVIGTLIGTFIAYSMLAPMNSE